LRGLRNTKTKIFFNRFAKKNLQLVNERITKQFKNKNLVQILASQRKKVKRSSTHERINVYIKKSAEKVHIKN